MTNSPFARPTGATTMSKRCILKAKNDHNEYMESLASIL